MAKSCIQPRGWSSIIQAVDTEDQGCCLAFSFSIWPFDGTWLISLGLPFAKMDDEQKELQSGVSVAFEKLTFKAVRLPRAREFDSRALPQHFTTAKCTPTFTWWKLKFICPCVGNYIHGFFLKLCLLGLGQHSSIFVGVLFSLDIYLLTPLLVLFCWFSWVTVVFPEQNNLITTKSATYLQSHLVLLNT